MNSPRWGRRDVLRWAVGTSGAMGLAGAGRIAAADARPRTEPTSVQGERATPAAKRAFNGAYTESELDHISFPLGGMGAGMVCLEGNGALARFSLRHRPDLVTARRIFAALSVAGLEHGVKVLEGPVPAFRRSAIFNNEWGALPDTTWGLPRFSNATFEARFPFATVRLKDERMPAQVELTGWSPFSPGDADNASLPVAGIEYRITNVTGNAVEALFSFHSENLMAVSEDLSLSRVLPTTGGVVFHGARSTGPESDEGHCAIWIDDPEVTVDRAWLRGRPFDQMESTWRNVQLGRVISREAPTDNVSPGASLFIPLKLAAGQSRTVTVRLAWYVPQSDLSEPSFHAIDSRLERLPTQGPTYAPWYAHRFAGIEELKNYWQGQYEELREAARLFSRTFFESTLPPEVLEAVAANLTILKSPTVMRQRDGRLWGWEGIYDQAGSCYGSANHVWNYAQAIPHLFPALERTLRETELGPNLGKDGFQAIRAALPIRPVGDTREDGFGFPAAADGQLGAIIKLHRDWRISGDREWLRRLWPRVRLSLQYCINTWDPKRRGRIEEPHVNTYDTEFWGADSMCTTLYLGALRAAVLMGEALGENVDEYRSLFTLVRQQLENELFNGEFFIQDVQWKDLHASFPRPENDRLASVYRRFPALLEVAPQEGPAYQYGGGCLADGVLGAWLCMVSGIGEILDPRKVENHLAAVYRHNFKRTLRDHASNQRAFFACGDEGGLLLCSWPRGNRPTLPFFFSDEVWTGTEYQVASHLVSIGRIEDGLEIVRTCRSRYDGRFRNPFAEVEAGHWYARAMSSFALLQAFSGARYDAVQKVLYVEPAIAGDFACFLSTATGYGTVGVKNGRPFVKVAAGEIPYREIKYRASSQPQRSTSSL